MDLYRKYASIYSFTFSLFVSVLANEKVWIPNTNFNNPQNWNDGRIPCHANRVIFPKYTEVSVFIQDNITVKEIFLPQYGEFILASRGEINIGVNSQKACDGKDALFIGSEVRHWYDAYNWKIREDWGNLNVASDFLDPVPQAERIPCSYDEVTFPRNSTFKVRIEGLLTNIKKFTINDKVLNSSRLKSFMESELGHKQFQIDSSLSVNGESCLDVAGCSCGNDETNKLKHICNHVMGKCPSQHCADPIQPAGSCCPVCGAIFTVALGSNFEFQKLKDYIGSFLKKPFYKRVIAYIFKTYLEKVQVVFVDEAPHRSSSLVKTLKIQLENDNEKSQLGIISCEAHYSVKWFDEPASYHGNDSGMSGGGIAALVLGLLSVAIIGILFYFQRHRLLPLALSFGRFENEDERYLSRGSFELAVEMTHAIDPLTGKQVAIASIQMPESTSASAKGFDNPFYDPSCTDSSDFKDASLPSKSYKSVDTRENPCYMVFEDLEDIPSEPPQDVGIRQYIEEPPTANK